MDERSKINLTIWQPDNRRGHIESYFLKINDPAQGKALWLKFTLLSPKGDPKATVGEVWAIVFDDRNPENITAFKETYPVEDCQLARERFFLSFGASSLEPGRTAGKLRGAGGDLTWDLRFSDGEAPLIPFRYGWMYTAKIPKSKTKTPYPASRFSGSFTLHGTTTELRDAPGMQGHNWGSEHSHLYAWAHCSAFEGHGDDTFFEGYSSRIKVGGMVTPYLSNAFLSVRGKRYLLNTPGSFISKDILVENNHWKFTVVGKTHSIRGDIHAPTEKFIALKYYNPDGSLSYCLNSKIADAVIELLDASGKVIERLESKRTTALEVLVKDANHGVRPGV